MPSNHKSFADLLLAIKQSKFTVLFQKYETLGVHKRIFISVFCHIPYMYNEIQCAVTRKKARIISHVNTCIYFAAAISSCDAKTFLIVHCRKVATLFENYDISSNKSTGLYVNVFLFHLIINDCIVHHKKQNVTQNKKCCIFFQEMLYFANGNMSLRLHQLQEVYLTEAKTTDVTTD